MKSITIDYKHFNDKGFDTKSCSIADVSMPNYKTSTKAAVYDTASHAPLFQNQHKIQENVIFTVEFLPFITGKELLNKAPDLVKEVMEEKYKPEPLTIFVHKKDGSIDTQVTINDTFIRQVFLSLNRKNEAKGEMGYIRICFTLEGLHPGRK